MKRQRKVLMEGLAVVLVLCVLLIVMMPRFMSSQVRVKIARSFADLEHIRDAMKSYNQSNKDDPVRFFYMQIDGTAGNPANQAAQVNIGGKNIRLFKVPELADTTKKNDPFLSYLESIPVPPLPQETMGGRTVSGPGLAPSLGSMYAVETRSSRFDKFNYLSMGPYGKCEHAEHVFNLHYGGHDFDYLGVAHGPLDNQTNHNVGLQPDHTMYPYYVPYDPSNGLISHGFLVAKMDPVPEEQRVEGKPPLPPEERQKIHHYPVKTDGSWLAGAAGAPAPATAVVTDPSGLVELHKQAAASLDSLELHLRGQFVDRWGIDLMFDRQYNIKEKVILGIAPGDVTLDEVNQFFKQSRSFRKYAMDYVFFWEKERQRHITQTPRPGRFPWENCEEKIQDATMYTAIDHSLNSYTRFESPTVTPDAPLRPKHRQFDVAPIDAMYPLSLLPGNAQLQIQPLADGLIRVKWDDPSESHLVWKLDCILDSNQGYAAVTTLLQERDSFTYRQMGNLLIETPTNMIITAILYDFGEYRFVNGKPIPKWMRITNWTHYNERYRGSRDPNAPGTYMGLTIPDVIGGAPLPGFHQQWYLEVQSVRVNEPLSEEVFDPEIQGKDYSFPEWVRTQIAREKRYREMNENLDRRRGMIRRFN